MQAYGWESEAHDQLLRHRVKKVSSVENDLDSVCSCALHGSVFDGFRLKIWIPKQIDREMKTWFVWSRFKKSTLCGSNGLRLQAMLNLLPCSLAFPFSHHLPSMQKLASLTPRDWLVLLPRTAGICWKFETSKMQIFLQYVTTYVIRCSVRGANYLLSVLQLNLKVGSLIAFLEQKIVLHHFSREVVK